jgi:hypothetical protein
MKYFSDFSISYRRPGLSMTVGFALEVLKAG